MSEENINTTQETGSVNDVETRQKEDKKCTCKLACVLEIITVSLSGVTVLAISWVIWIGSIFDGNQMIAYTSANNASNESSILREAASTELTQDMLTWNEINILKTELSYATRSGDEKAQEKCKWMIDEICMNRVSENFQVAIDWSSVQSKNVTPFDMEGYVESYYTAADEKAAQAASFMEQGAKDKANADAYRLSAVILGVVLFLLSMTALFKNKVPKIVLCSISALVLILALVYMFTIPLPAGFSLLSYF